ncbi:MAG TPA: L,D-transpeptidase [Novosphingobium sp.]
MVGMILLSARFPTPIDRVPVVKYVDPPGPRLRYPAERRPTLTLAGGEARKISSVLNVSEKMRFGDFVWNDEGVAAGPAWARIDLARQVISVFRGDDEIGTAVILYGTDGMPTPTGHFAVRKMDPAYYSRSYDAPMPFAMFLTDDGVAIHASNVRSGFATHGCIGVPEGFARRLFAEIKRGDSVWVLPPAAAPAQANRAT